MRDLLKEYVLLEGKTLSLVPAYGRDYKSKKAIQVDLDADKDFVIADMMNRWDGKPANRRDLMAQGYTQVKVRYAKLRKVAILKLTK